MKLLIKNFILTLLPLFIAAFVFAQEGLTLTIGDPAPPMKYSKWIKGDPVTSFDRDQLYVVEFWATWCGPCKAAMPHLTELQKEYTGKATFIGVNVWEGHGDEDKLYESYLPKITKFVEGNAANMGYSVIADNNEQFMGNHWLKAAGQNGIPSTFIIKNNQIIWIGHPIKLDTTLPKILNGSYNMQEFKVAFEEKTKKSMKRSAKIKAAMEPVQNALKAKKYKKAFELMEEAKKAAPILTISLDNMKFNTLLKEVSEEKAIAFAKEWKKDFERAPLYIVGAVSKEEGLQPATYLWAANNYMLSIKQSKDESQTPNPVLLHMLASCYAKGGDYSNAVINEEKAVAAAKLALKEGRMVGTIMDYTVKEYEQQLAEYKKASK